jgi:hypothetical protein
MTKTRKVAYVRPTAATDARPDEQTQLPTPNGKSELARARDIITRLRSIKSKCQSYIYVVDTAITLVERGVTLPDEAAAIGLPPTIPRASKPLNTWRIRPDSNMAVIAEMLEAAGTKGVAEVEMMSRLRDLGRLGDAEKPLRAVHYTVSELAKRTKFVERRSRNRGSRWYAFGSLSTWRKPTA